MNQKDKIITTLHNLLDYEIKKITTGEVLLNEVLPQWINTATSIKLKAILQKYKDWTAVHIQSMQGYLTNENTSAALFPNRIMQVFVEDTINKIDQCSDMEVKDAALLASVQEINHYKICAYGTAAAFARSLNLEKEADLFRQAEVNEKQIDDRLTQLAEFEINSKAKAPIVLT
jgi:ferritin-like metal-binding protein YciE